MTSYFRVTFTSEMYRRLTDHLFPGDDHEHGAVIGAGLASTSEGPRLLVRELMLAEDGIDYVPGERGYRMLTASFVRDCALRCRDEELCYLAVHNHGGTGSVNFSSTDLDSHLRGYPALVALMRGRPAGALVFASDAVAGDLFMSTKSRLALSQAVVVGGNRHAVTPSSVTSKGREPRFERQSRLFGDRGQEILGALRVGVIGVGGVGSLLVEYLARLGVGNLVIADPERLDETNLPRVVGAGEEDLIHAPRFISRWVIKRLIAAPAAKVVIASRLARQANSNCRIEAIQDDFLKLNVARQFIDCDYIFLAADTMRCRLLYNAICHQYLIPGVQVGSKASVVKGSGSLSSVFSVARPTNLDGGCLWCNGLIPPGRLQQEAATEAEEKQQRYVDDPTVPAPSVITLNAVGASYAANEFLFNILGLRTNGDRATRPYFRADSLSGEVLFDEPRVDLACPECSKTQVSRWARGDGRLLPTAG